jgi:hypothetical protein
MDEIPFDSRRRLCPDGACVGVIGRDGRCSVCRRLETALGGAAEVETTDDDPSAPSSFSSSSPSSVPDTAFDSNRRLCDDGSCVGVVGADGVCGTCGRKAE